YLQEAPRPGTRRSISDMPAKPFEAPVPDNGYAAGSEEVAKKSVTGLNLANGDIVDWVARHPALNGIKDAFGIYVFSDSMEPRYFRGELIYVHPGRPAEPNKDCVIEMKNGDAYIKRLLKVGDQKIRVRQFNPPGDSDVPLKDVQALYSVIGRG
ncbi:MAG TPA: S24 family peptidase, partial [Patescibacteria group bacterium]|nr:S24 family peptidase [Patescibacteria group bacterium]